MTKITQQLAQKLVSLLKARDFRAAADAVAESRRAGPLVEELMDIFHHTPSILSALTSEALAHLRIAAAMLLLTGQSRAKRWLPNGLELGIKMNNEAAARMLLFHAGHQRKLRQSRAHGFRTAEVCGAKDSRHCAACREIDGKSYRLDDLPELPYPRCTCEDGCRCTALYSE